MHVVMVTEPLDNVGKLPPSLTAVSMKSKLVRFASQAHCSWQVVLARRLV